MTSDKQLQANRRNALLSTGPKTPEGKRIASRISLKHGILARETVISAGEVKEDTSPASYRPALRRG